MPRTSSAALRLAHDANTDAEDEDPSRELVEFAKKVLDLTLPLVNEEEPNAPELAKLLLLALGVLERHSEKVDYEGMPSTPASGERAILAPESAVELVLARNRRSRR